MKKFLPLLLMILAFTNYNAQNIYSKAYGNRENPAIIFIHGGPSGNSNLFEGTTAEKLADKGFYVIVYDRRGEGRSKDQNAEMTFNESFDDLNEIYKTYNLQKANILAHSFGGIIGTLFTNKFPEKVNSLILAGALFSQQETYNHIIKNAKIFFAKDSIKINQIKNTEVLEKNSAEYRKNCFDLASDMNYFSMPLPTEESIITRENYEKSIYAQTSFRNTESPKIFYKNEPQNNLNIKGELKKIISHNVPVYAIYGENDNIFSKKQLSNLKHIVGNKNFKILNNCSHYLFVDQQIKFLNFIEEKLNRQKIKYITCGQYFNFHFWLKPVMLSFDKPG